MQTAGWPRPPKFARKGRMAQYSFVTRDKDGTARREWHTVAMAKTDMDAALSKSLRGMVRV